MNVKQLREAMGLNGAAFARRCGISVGHLHDIEGGKRNLTLEMAARIERATNRKGLIQHVVAERTQAA